MNLNGNDEGGFSFEIVYDTVFPILIRIAFHITGDEAAAEDMVQEAFIRYYNRPIPLPSLDQAKYWLIRVVKNLCYNYEKRKGRERRAYDRVLREPVKEEESGELGTIKKETRAIVRDALEKVPIKLRTPLVLKEYGGLNYKEISSLLKITEGNVKVRVFRAREYMEKLLDREDVYVSG